MKKNINKAEEYVKDMLNGVVKTNKNLRLIDEQSVVYRSDIDKDKVQLISGGGAGHEPAHGGFVGKGMLSAAVSGHIFSSPTPIQVKAAIDALEANNIFLVIKNYTGDVMNFKIAADLAKGEGKNVDYIIIDDDVAVQNSTWTEGKRGVAGTIFVHKIAGAKAEEGASLEEVKRVAEKVRTNVKSMGIALEAGVNPTSGKKSFELAEDEFEFGIGIHGEPGIEKKKVTNSKDMVKQMMDKILSEINIENEEIVLMVNGMGGTPLSELYIAANDVVDYLQSKNAKIYDSKVGDYMTSLDMKGFSITILKLDDELKNLYDAKTSVKLFK